MSKWRPGGDSPGMIAWNKGVSCQPWVLSWSEAGVGKAAELLCIEAEVRCEMLRRGRMVSSRPTPMWIQRRAKHVRHVRFYGNMLFCFRGLLVAVRGNSESVGLLKRAFEVHLLPFGSCRFLGVFHSVSVLRLSLVLACVSKRGVLTVFVVFFAIRVTEFGWSRSLRMLGSRK